MSKNHRVCVLLSWVANLTQRGNQMPLRNLLALAFVFLLGGCGAEVMMVSDTTSFTDTDQLVLRKPAQNFIDVASAVGTSLGYHVSGIDRQQNSIGLSKTAGLGMGVLIGEINEVNVTLTLAPDNRTIKISVVLMANFNKGGQDAANKIVSDLKAGLAKEFG
jgi:hypothetical protein